MCFEIWEPEESGSLVPPSQIAWQNRQQSCRANSNHSAGADAQPDAQLPKPHGSAVQHPLSRHHPAAPPTLPIVQTWPLPAPSKIIAQSDCSLSSTCRQSLFALQGNHPQAAIEHMVKAPHLFLGVYGLFRLSCPSSFSSHLLKHPALQ